MSREIVLSPRARLQLFAALRWWYGHRDKAPNALDEELDVAWDILRTTPEAGRVVQAKRPGVRRIFMERVHYYIYYRVGRSGSVEVLAIWHASRQEPRL